MTNEPQSESPLPGEILQQGRVVERVIDLESRIAEIAGDIQAAGVRNIVMTGCGDSLFAAMAAQFGFASFSRTLTHAMHSLEYSRAFYRTSTEHTLVCALSYGGETRRTLEAGVAARHAGARVLAISVDDTGPIPQLADWFLPNVAPPERSNCRTGSFQAAYLELTLLAAHLARERGTLAEDDFEALRDEVRRLASTLSAYPAAVRDEAEEVGRSLEAGGQIFYLGGGEAYAAALYGSAKLYETSSVPSIPQESEQFAHCEIFSLERDSLVVVIALSGPFYDRAVQVADAVRTIGATVIGVSDASGFGAHADRFIQIPKLQPPRFPTSVAVVPLQWMAYADARQRGANPDLVRHKEVNSPLIRESPIWSPEDYTNNDTSAEGGSR